MAVRESLKMPVPITRTMTLVPRIEQRIKVLQECVEK
jgi:hypothetical protein